MHPQMPSWDAAQPVTNPANFPVTPAADDDDRTAAVLATLRRSLRELFPQASDTDVEAALARLLVYTAREQGTTLTHLLDSTKPVTRD